eukprot:15567335-Heterocapsa_arctica.AAC.1
MNKNSRFGWVPHGAIFDWLCGVWGAPLTETIFWSIILHTKNDKEHYHSYMIRYWPKINLVLIKTIPKGGVEADRKRKREVGDSKPDDYKGSKGGGKQ